MKHNRKLQTVLILCLAMLFTSCNNQPQVEDESYAWMVNDSNLKVAISKEFKVHPYITSNDINIRVEDGIVTLHGTTDNLIEKQEAKELVSLIRGVRGVVNLVKVDTKQVSNNLLAEYIDDALYQDPVLESYEIHAKVDNGRVDLYGRVDSWHEKQLASDVVKSVEGVKQVNNNIAFVYKEDRPEMEMIADIEGFLRNDIRIDDGLIKVQIKNDTAVLRGKVGSAAEKSLAVVHAYVPGVDTVLSDELAVVAEEENSLMRKDKYVYKPDYLLIEAIQQTFLQDPRLLNHDIKVQADSGKIILTGKVNDMRAKKAAGADAGNVVGVWSVENKLEVQPLALPAEKVVIDNVTSAIDRHPLFDNYKIVALEDSGKVTLEGDVKFYFEKVLAEDVVSQVPGVVDVANKIEVTEGIEFPFVATPTLDDSQYPVIQKPTLKDDEQIKEDVNYQLWWSPVVDRNQIDVQVENGKVTLTGTVNTSYEMDAAVRNAYEGGAFQVVNRLKVDFWQL